MTATGVTFGLSVRHGKVRRVGYSITHAPSQATRFPGTMGLVSQAERVTVENVDLDADERAWLAERLQEYRDLLDYLHDH